MVEGTEELLRKLRSLSREMQQSIVKKAVGKATLKVEAVAKFLCPVDSGELRDRGIEHVIEAAGDEITGTVYTNKEYAPYVEFGTGPRGQENHSGISPEITPTYSQKGWSYKDENGEWVYTNGQAAQPFLYPALKDSEERVKRIISQEIARGIDEVIN